MQNALYLSLGVLLLFSVGGVAWTYSRRSKRAIGYANGGSAFGYGAGDRARDDRPVEAASSRSTRDTDPVAVVPIRPAIEPSAADLRASTERTEPPATSSPDAAMRLTATSLVAGDDVITGLPNRAKFLEEFDLRLRALRRSHSPHCIAMVRIDRFGDLRSERGMRASELVLQSTAARLQATMRDGDIVARFDRDTFVLSLADLSAREAPGAVERLRRSACQEIQLEAEGAPSIVVTASSSFASVDPDSEAAQLVACCRGALAMARSEESLAVS